VPDPTDVSIAVEAAAFGVRDLALSKGGAHAIAGGSAVGTVVEAGVAAAEWLNRRVVVPRLNPCGECPYCRRGAVAGCVDGSELGVTAAGTLAPKIETKARWLAPADGDLALAAPTAAFLGDDGLLAYGLYCRAGVAAGEPVVCVGAGPRTAIVAAIARAKGAKVAVASSADEFSSIDGEGFRDRPWRIFALDGSQLASVPAGSSVALAGGAAIDLASAVAGGCSIVGGEAGHPDLLPELVALAVRGAVELSEIAEVVSGDIAAAAADVIGSGRVPVSLSD